MTPAKNASLHGTALQPSCRKGDTTFGQDKLDVKDKHDVKKTFRKWFQTEPKNGMKNEQTQLISMSL